MTKTPALRKKRTLSDQYGQPQMDNAHSTVNRSSVGDEKPMIYEKSKARFRWLVLFLSCFAMFGSYYSYDNVAALQNQFQNQYDLNAFEYNMLYSVYSFPNIILPLFGGVFVDRIGAETCLVVFLSTITLGQAIFALGTSFGWYWLMIVGRVVFGFGGESLCVAESALLGVWFKGSEMAFAMGLNLSLARGGSSLNDVATYFVYEKTNKISLAIWAGFALLVLCLIMTILMVFLDYRQTKNLESKGYVVPKATSDDRFECKDIKEFEYSYWLLTISCLVVYGCVLPFNNIGAGFMQDKFRYSHATANAHLLIPYTISAAATPFVGYAVDRIGRRAKLLLVSAVCLAFIHFLFAFTMVNPAVGLVIDGIAYSIYAAAIWPSVALVVPEAKLGTAYGLITSVQNFGLAMFPLIIGILTTKMPDGSRMNYKDPEMFMMCLGVLGIMTGVLVLMEDARTGYRLDKPSLNAEEEDEKVEPPITSPHREQLLAKQKRLDVPIANRSMPNLDRDGRR